MVQEPRHNDTVGTITLSSPFGESELLPNFQNEILFLAIILAAKSVFVSFDIRVHKVIGFSVIDIRSI